MMDLDRDYPVEPWGVCKKEPADPPHSVFCGSRSGGKCTCTKGDNEGDDEEVHPENCICRDCDQERAEIGECPGCGEMTPQYDGMMYCDGCMREHNPPQFAHYPEWRTEDEILGT